MLFRSNIDPTSYSLRLPGSFDNFGSLTSPLDFSDASRFWLSTFWWGGGAYSTTAHVRDEVSTARVSLGRDLDAWIFDRLDAGIVYSDRRKSLHQQGSDYALAHGEDCIMIACAPIPASMLSSPVSLGFAKLGHLAYFNVMNALDGGSEYVRSPDSGRDLAWNWDVNERV